MTPLRIIVFQTAGINLALLNELILEGICDAILRIRSKGEKVITLNQESGYRSTDRIKEI